MGRKKNENDLTVAELKKRGIDSGDYAEAGEVCMEFLEDFQSMSRDERIDACTRILDNQRKDERFSDTFERLYGDEYDPYL